MSYSSGASESPPHAYIGHNINRLDGPEAPQYSDNSGTVNKHGPHESGHTVESAPNISSVSPPSTPSQRLLQVDNHPQFALYPPQEKEQPWNENGDDIDDKLARGWTPIPLQPWFWISLSAFMVLVAIGLEIALHFNKQSNGWKTSRGMTSESGFMHFVYTLPPVIIAMFIVAMLTWVDIEIKKMQPYIDLLYGDSPPQKSLLLDYTRTNNFVVWISAFWNRHYMVAIATLLALFSLVFQPLAAALFTVRDTWWTHPPTNVTNMAALGLNEGTEFQDLTSFLSASGYASSSVLYNLGDPAFVHDKYTIGPFQIPIEVATNGTVIANTTAIKSDSYCTVANTVSTPIGNESWNNTATFNDCTFSFIVNKTTNHLFGTDVMPDCGNTGVPPSFRPIVIWFFTYDTTPPQGSSTYCAPAISLWDVEVQVDIITRNLTSVRELRPFNSSTSPFSSLSSNITGLPLNGRAYNGVAFNLTNADQFVNERARAVTLQLPSSILESAEISPGGLNNAFSTNSFVGMATQVYTMYLKLIAKTVYFLPTTQSLMVVEVKSFEKRLWLSDVAVHILVVVLFLIAIVGALVQILHSHARRRLRLRHEPGTIASAVSIGAQTNLATLLNGRQQDDDFIKALRNHKFRIDPRSMKIVMEGELGYEQAASPDPRRSIFGVLGLQSSSGNKRFSGLGFGRTSPVSR